MDVATILKGQSVREDVRRVGINPNYWYPVGWAAQIKPGQVTPITLWQQQIALYRDSSGAFHALEDACPHRRVALHTGKVTEQTLICRYHGWEFNSEGECIKIPYLQEGQKLPCARVRSYPVQEKYGLVWLFPGNPELANLASPPEVPEFAQPGLFDVSVTSKYNAHFSFCNENSMDMFHGYLHQELQGWFNPILRHLEETENSVRAEYQVSYKGQMAKLLGLTDSAKQVTTSPLLVEYNYPHYHYILPGISSGYLMRWPVGLTETRSFSLFFFPLPFPKGLINPIKPLIQNLLRRVLLHRFLAQDIEMIESEQQNYLLDPNQRCVEINPAVIAVQRLIVRQSRFG
jgi:phenylpropionate dioxygenase-like ring-hydroxylating dioxygenase large terminal subunit